MHPVRTQLDPETSQTSPSSSPSVVPTTTTTVRPTTTTAAPEPVAGPESTPVAPETTTVPMPPPFSEQQGQQVLEQVNTIQQLLDEAQTETIKLDTNQFGVIVFGVALMVALLAATFVTVVRR